MGPAPRTTLALLALAHALDVPSAAADEALPATGPSALQRCAGFVSRSRSDDVAQGSTFTRAAHLVRKQVKFNASDAFRLHHFPVPKPDAVRWVSAITQPEPSARPTCAVVGNSCCLEGSGRGAEIDSHDVVMRFNFAPVGGHEADVGSKTTTRMMLNAAVTVDAREEGTVILHRYDWRGTRRAQDRLRNVSVSANSGYNLLEIRHSMKSTIPRSRSYVGGASSGFIGVFLALRACSSVSVYGFDVQGKCRGHYYDEAREGLLAAFKRLSQREAWRWKKFPDTVLPFTEKHPSERMVQHNGVDYVEAKPGILEADAVEAYGDKAPHPWAMERSVLRTLDALGCVRVVPCAGSRTRQS